MTCYVAIQDFSPWWNRQPAEVRTRCNVGMMGDALTAYDGAAGYVWTSGHVILACPADLQDKPDCDTEWRP